MKLTSVISLCSGIGAFEKAIVDVIGQDRIRVGFSEIDKNAIGVYRKHFPESMELGNLQQISRGQLDQLVSESTCQIVVAGFPCQNISMANNVTRHGLKGEKSGLFRDVMRVIHQVRTSKTPQQNKLFVVIENVRGSSATMDEITQTLRAELSEDKIYVTPIDSSHFSAQARVRNFWTNFPISTNYPSVDELVLADALMPIETVMQRIGEVQMSPKFVAMYNKIMKEKPAVNSYHASLVKTTPTGVMYWRHTVEQNKPRARWQKYPFSDSAQPKSKTITTNHPNFHIIERRNTTAGEGAFIVRKFFAEELERLFCFPHGWTAETIDGLSLSNNDRIKLLGNSIVVTVVRHIVTDLLKA